MKRFAQAIALFSAGSLLGTLTQVAKGKLSALLLGPAGVGVTNQLTNAFNLGFAVAGLGFYSGLVRRIAEAEAKADRAALARQLSTSLIFLTGVACLGAAVGALLASTLSHWLFADHGERAAFVAVTVAAIPFAIAAQTYKGLLGGCKQVRPIVSAQVISDLLGLALFVALVFGWGLAGAVLAFSGLQVLKLALQIVTLRRALPDIAVLPRWRDFAWSEVRVNLGYGVNGLFLVAVSALTTLVVSRWIIDASGLEANGLFSVAWKVSSVYFGAIYASASSFYFPSLVACRDDAELGARINEAVSLYFYVLPPLIVGLLVTGEDLMRLLFSASFVPAALLLLGLLPGDLFRVLAEAQGMAFLARRRLLPYTATYVLWALAYLGLAHVGLQRYGVAGVALAYFAAQIASALAVHAFARRIFAYAVDAATARRVALGFGVVAAAAGLLLATPTLPWRYAGGAALLALWLALAWRDAAFRDLAHAAWRKGRARLRGPEPRDG